MSFPNGVDPKRPDLLFLVYVQRKNQSLVEETLALSRDNRYNKVLGCILGLAVGDVIGCPVEGMSYQDIQARYGYVGGLLFPSYWRHWRLAGLHSDDTQQGLAVLDAIKCVNGQSLRRVSENNAYKIAYELGSIYVQGLEGTQLASFGCWRGTGQGFRGVVENLARYAGRSKKDELFATSSSREKRDQQWPFGHGSPSAGLGAVMRIPPVGVLVNDFDSLLRTVSLITNITHTDPLATASACSVALACRLLEGESVKSFRPERFLSELQKQVKEVEKRLKDLPGTEASYRFGQKRDFLNSELIATVGRLDETDPRQAIRKIGQQTYDMTGQKGHPMGGFAPPGVAASLYFFIADFEDPRKAMLTSINAGGDTDTIGAIVGALCGVLHGPKAYEEFLPDLVALDLILSKVKSVAEKGQDLDLVKEESFLTEIEDGFRSVLSHLH